MRDALSRLEISQDMVKIVARLMAIHQSDHRRSATGTPTSFLILSCRIGLPVPQRCPDKPLNAHFLTRRRSHIGQCGRHVLANRHDLEDHLLAELDYSVDNPVFRTSVEPVYELMSQRPRATFRMHKIRSKLKYRPYALRGDIALQAIDMPHVKVAVKQPPDVAVKECLSELDRKTYDGRVGNGA